MMYYNFDELLTDIAESPSAICRYIVSEYLWFNELFVITWSHTTVRLIIQVLDTLPNNTMNFWCRNG